MMQDAGADALELNIYFIATDPNMSGSDVESRYVDLVAAVKRVGLDPAGREDRAVLQLDAQHGHAAGRAGADGLVLFNRFLQPDIDLETLRVAPSWS